MKYSIFIVLILSFSGLHAQEISLEKLQAMGDEELLTLFTEVSEDSTKAEIVARVYLERGRREKDTIKMARGYDRLARIFQPEKNIQFADSVIELTKHLKHRTYPALGYILKSFEFHRLGNLIQKTENALIAYNLALDNKNISQQIYVSDFLIYSKSIWGNKKEALELQKERHRVMSGNDYFQKVKESSRKGIQDINNDIYLENELSSISNFVYCHLNLKNLDSSRYFYLLGSEKLDLYNGPNKKDFQSWFTECSVEIDFYSKHYKSAIRTSDLLLDNESLSNSSKLNLNFFKGLSFLELRDFKTGINFLLSADSIYNEHSILLQPYHRELFEVLLEYSTRTNNTNKQIEYLNKLIEVDSVFKMNYKYFEPDLIRNFETPKLLKEKEDLIAGLKRKNKNSTKKMWWGGSLLVILLLTLFYYVNRQIIYKKRFENLMSQQKAANDNAVSKEGSKMQISPSIIEDILSRLDEFELNKDYLSQQISLHDLAVSFGTNPRYLSKVINLQKDKNFRRYINDLRVEHALKELTEKSRFRKYTIKAIAGDCGFKSAESFSKAFYKRHGIYPSYYIKKLENKTE